MTPEQIAALDLKVVRRGYDVAQVDAVLDQLADELEELRAALAQTRVALARATTVDEAHAPPPPPPDDQVTPAPQPAAEVVAAAETAARTLVEDARQQAATILADAEAEAGRARDAATDAVDPDTARLQRRREQLEAHVASLQEFERGYRTRLREHFAAQVRRLDELTDATIIRATTADALLVPEEPPNDDTAAEPEA